MTADSAMKLVPALRTPNMITGVWRRFGVHAFEGRLSLEDMARLEGFGNLWHKKNPGNVVELVVIFPSDARMTGEERGRMATMIRRWEGSRTAAATVVMANGLVGSMQRSVLTGLMLIAPPPHPTKVFGTTLQAITWLMPHLRKVCGDDVTIQDTTAAVDALCAAFQSAGPSIPPAQSNRSHSGP